MVGAGPTGLVLALALTRAGVAVRVVDSRTGTAVQSRALDVQARTLEHYRSLGVADRLVFTGTRIEALSIRRGGCEVSRTDVGHLGDGLSAYPYLLCCPQDEHEAVLLDALAAAGVAVEWETSVTAVVPTDDAVGVTLATPRGQEVSSVGWLCGCDGGRSTVRDQLDVPFRGDRSPQAYYVADVVLDGAGRDTGAATQFSFCLHDDDFVVAVPARRSGTTRLIGRVPTALAGHDGLGFDDLRGSAERAVGTGVRAVSWFSTYQVTHRVVTRLRTGRTFLLGDAAHLHSPLGGQGMNTGIGDAVNLAWKLAAVLQGRAAPALLDTVDAERLPVARTLVRTTDRVFRLVDGPGRRARAARAVVFGTLLPALLRRRATRSRLVGAISQVGLGYRSSPLSAGRSGRLRGGDRLPWVPAAGGDNHGLLDGLDWQLHVHGRASAAVRRLAADRGLTLHELPWSAGAHAAGLRRDAVHLVRPDGYLAGVGHGRRTGALQRVLDTYEIRPRDRRPAPPADGPVAGGTTGPAVGQVSVGADR